MKNSRKQKFKRLAENDTKFCLAVLACVAVAFGMNFINSRLPDGYYIPYCISHDVFHLYCPFCGCTRAGIALVRLDFVGSLVANPLVILFCIIFVCYNVVSVVLICKDKRIPNLKRCGTGAVCFLLLFAVVRNILMIFFGFDTLSELIVFWR